MKKLLLIISLACANVLIAQPTLNINGVQFLPGFYSYNMDTEQQSVPESGANVTWDYSNLISESLYSSTNESYNGSEYPNATLRGYNNTGESFFSQNSTGIYMEGLEAFGQGFNIVFNFKIASIKLLN
jgi:hypothetical protein